MRTVLLGVVLGVTACSVTFDGDTPEARLVGNPPDMTKFPRLNKAPVRGEGFVYSPDGTVWFTMREMPHTLHSVLIPDGTRDESLDYDPSLFEIAAIMSSSFFFVDKAAPGATAPVKLTIRSPGSSPDAVLMVPPGPAQIGAWNYESIFYYWPKSPTTTRVQILFRDKSPSRSIPIPDGIDPENPGGIGFSGDGRILYTRDAKNRLVAHSTREAKDIDLGIRPPSSIEYPAKRALITVGKDGVRVVPLDGSPDQVLDPQPVDENVIFVHEKRVWYQALGQLLSVPPDGSGPPRVEKSGGFQRVLGFAPDGTMIYSKDAGDKYIYGAGDGWVGDWNFMERGRGAFFGADGKTLRWLDRAAQTTGAGDLMSATVGGTPVRLARNVEGAQELQDGRLIALANRASYGTWNRLIAIDEKAGTATWVAVGVGRSYDLITQDQILVDVITGATTHDVLRVPIPPKSK